MFRRLTVSLPPATPQPTVYIVDDDSGVRKSLCWLIETVGVPVKAFASAASFLDECDVRMPGCLVLDVVMPGMSGLELQEELRRRGVEIPVIMLTGYGDVPTAVRALKNGAIEFLEKPVDDDALLDQVQRALALDARRRKERGEFDNVFERMTHLTPREHEVLDLVVDGLSSKEIAAQLSVSFKTVEAHRAKIMTKMEAESVADLVRLVVGASSLIGGPDSRSRAVPGAVRTV
jgi:two-component system, LuxR family, response regulator FixJ